MFDVMLFICSHRSDMIFLARRPLNDHCRGFVYEVSVGPYLKSELSYNVSFYAAYMFTSS